jgi:hypothetical protein
MMKRIGNTLLATVILFIALGTTAALGAVTASLDRNRVALGDTLRLTITATDDEDISESALQPLLADFDIVQRSTSSNTSIVNGHVSQSRQMNIDLAPRREATLQIPAMQFGKSRTPAMTVLVGPTSDTHTAGQTVVFQAEVDRDSVYVQGQVILTLRVLQSVSLEGRSISDLKLDNAFVKPLEQHSYQRTIDGQPWLVDEIRYAIFPEHSGTLQLPGQVFSGRVNRGRRGFFDLGGGGQLVRRSTAPITITVKPKPDNYPVSDWLPTRSLTLQESWSTPPEQLRVGESATRTIRILGEGLQGAQLPPIMFTPIDGLKYYPDQPTISEQEIPGGLEGIREDSAVVVPTQPGTYTIPEVRIPWWDTQTEQLQYAILPPRELTVIAGEPASSPAAPPAPSPKGDLAPDAAIAIGPAPAAPPYLWQLVSAVSTLGWFLTLLYLWRKRAPASPAPPTHVDNASEKKAFKQLLGACTQGQAASARAALIDWAGIFLPGTGAVSLDEVARQFGDAELTRELEFLDASLYRPGTDNWAGDSLAACLRRLRTEYFRTRPASEKALQLYPQ